MSHATAFLRRMVGSKRVAIGAVLLGVLALLAIFAELLAAPAPIACFRPGRAEILPAITEGAALESLTEAELRVRFEGFAIWPPIRYGPEQRTDAGPNASPSLDHPLGTDFESRDLAARLIYGARTALGLSLSAVLVGMFLGVVLGGLAGTLRGVWNDGLVRLVETVDTFPAILVVAIVRAIEREPSALSLVLAVAFVRWAEIARLVRAEVLRASSEEYVMAARALGSTRLRVFYRHILPNALGPVIVSSVLGVASVVLLEAAISFLGMGAPARVASWGETLGQAARHPSEIRLLVFPFVLLLATVGGSYLIADALRDSIDTRTVRTRVPR
ncbi:oligopeptide ABC transporter, permease component [Sorangium cellulosum So ce56]|uniref:Oligopeptide ABC transporter, permease component n=1 Tax=Sorangium cellulosum (strain So ce56) TaxID=448385 RepID=A9FQW2_SORC5|nr:ABC transporter permease [Sorangium cellulosum]CAN92195.1 oligopeptide ABC transporter, permease component [Sorangium cellulosum So ce56]